MTNARLFLSLFLLCSALILPAQSTRRLQREQKVGMSESSFKHSIQNFDGNFALVGSTKSALNTGLDVRFTITNTRGTILKDTLIVGGNNDDMANSITTTLDGGYLIVGSTKSKRKGAIGKQDAWIIKTDENGTPLWDSVWGVGRRRYFHRCYRG